MVANKQARSHDEATLGERALGVASIRWNVALARWGLALGLVGATLFGCSSPSHDAPPPAVDDDAGMPTQIIPGTCSTPSEGCACDKVNEAVNCGEVIFKSDSYITCSVGTRTCEKDHKWSTCVGQQVITLNAWQNNGLHPQGQPTGTAAGNACDPFLYQVNSDLTNGDAGIGDGGLTIGDAGDVELTKVIYPAGCTGAQSITITPNTSPATDIVITTVASPPTPDSVQFMATLPPCAGANKTPVWTIDQPSVATITSDGLFKLIYPYVGPVNVTAYAGGISASVTVHVTVSAVDSSQVAGGAAIATSFLTTCGVP